MKFTHKIFPFTSKLCVLIVFVLLFIANCSLQSQITWQKLYDGPEHSYDGAYAICASDSGNMFVGGYSSIPTHAFLIKINKYGDTLWSKWLVGVGHEIMSLVSSGDGGCVATGYGGTAYALKVSSSGQIIWTKYYGAQNSYEIKKTFDGGYICCGDIGSGGFDGYVFKIDSSGILQWDKYYSNIIIRSIEQAQNGNYIICGFVHLGNGYYAEIASDGTIVWEKFMNSDMPSFARVKKLNSSYLFGGSKSDSLTHTYLRAFVYMTDTSGNRKMFKEYYSTHDERLTDIIVINENKYVFTTNRDSIFTNYNSRFFVIDSSLNVKKSLIVYNSLGDLWFQTVMQAPSSPNADLVFAGIGDIIPMNFDNVYVMRLDSSLTGLPPFGIQRIGISIPVKFNLHQNYPNPFNPNTKIKFDLPKDVLVTITIYDILGRVVSSFNDFKKAGVYEYDFDGSALASGLYFYKVESGPSSETKKMVLVK